MTMTTDGSRRHRSDGERSRQAILVAAARLASSRGIDRLSIGELALRGADEGLVQALDGDWAG